MRKNRSITTLFAQALEIGSPTAQSSFLKKACEGDTQLLAQVEHLLELAPEVDAGFLGGIEAPLVFAAVGNHIGPYTLLQVIGEGAFGTVFLADQREPVRRKVALKVLKPGMNSPQIATRFEAERQALALMDHPGIAKVYDAGVTESGQSYFVMEFVSGVPITAYCNEVRLPIRERLALFAEVCKAVQHSHIKGVIHRDIKPSNILVTMTEGGPAPKVIDFGIAKANDQKLTLDTFATQLGSVMGTFGYMSPEQADPDCKGVDARSDIYSLGAVLYELLTGLTPLDETALRMKTLLEALQAIRDSEPLKPSTRISASKLELETLSQLRRAEPQRLVRQIQGELDWIAMKALDKDRTRRYESAAALARDIERYLNDEPVEASPPGTVYRTVKFVRRHRVAVGAAAAVTLAVLLGLVTSTSLYFKERDARKLAEIQTKKANAESSKKQQTYVFISGLLNNVVAKTVATNNPLLQRVLGDASRSLDSDFTQQPEVEADLRDAIGVIYEQAGNFEAAEAMCRKAVDLRRKIFGEESLETARSYLFLGDCLKRAGKAEESIRVLRQALAIIQKVQGPQHQDTALCINNLVNAIFLYCQADPGPPLDKIRPSMLECETLSERSLAIIERLSGEDSPVIAQSLINLANVQRYNGKLAVSNETLKRALRIRTKQLGANAPALAEILLNQALFLVEEDKVDEAKEPFKQAIALEDKRIGPEHVNVAVALTKMGKLLLSRSRFSDAEDMFANALVVAKKDLGDENPMIATMLDNLAEVERKLGKTSQAQAFENQSRELKIKLISKKL